MTAELDGSGLEEPERGGLGLVSDQGEESRALLIGLGAVRDGVRSSLGRDASGSRY